MFYKQILQLFYPAHCTACLTIIPEEFILCSSCAALLKPVVSLYLPLTKRISLPVFAAYAYDGPARTLLMKKFSFNLLASRQLAQLVLKALPSQCLQADYLIPIPLHWSRYARRGFNQATEIARELSRQTQIPVLQLLGRSKRTEFQSRLSRDKREGNVADAFGVNFWHRKSDLSFLAGKRIILVDDLCTTGATLKSAAQFLLAYKPAAVSAVVACRAV